MISRSDVLLSAAAVEGAARELWGVFADLWEDRRGWEDLSSEAQEQYLVSARRILDGAVNAGI